MSERKPAEKVLETEWGTIRYWVTRCIADGPWLVFLPGLTADHRLFDRQIEGLGEKYRCLVWDAPAHGKSRPFRLCFSMEDLARWLHGILEKEGVVRPVLVGQSLGGYIAQVYMELFPEDAAGFISIDSCSLKRKYYTSLELALLKRTKGMYRSIPWKMLQKWGANGTAESAYGRALMRETVQSYGKEEYCALADHGYRILAQAVEADRPYGIPCPALLLCGEKDGAGSAKSYNRRWSKQDGLPLIWLPGAGHNANTDVPEEVNRIIADFVDQIT